MTYYKYKLFLLFLLLVLNSQLYGQFNYAGREFYYSFGALADPVSGSLPAAWPVTHNSILLASKHTATVTFEYTNTGQRATYSVPANSVISVKPSYAEVNAMTTKIPEQVCNNSLHIIADSAITVTVINVDTFAEDATHLLPVENQPKADEYHLLGLEWASVLIGYRYVFVATCDSVLLEITPSERTSMHLQGIPYTVLLQKGQTYELLSTVGMPSDLSGTRVRILHSLSNFPLVVLPYIPEISGTSAFYRTVGAYRPCCGDWTFEQLLPVNWWDKFFPVMDYDSVKGYRIKVLSSTNNNSLYINGVFVQNLNVGNIFDTVLYDPAIVSADKPIGVANFMLSYDTGRNGDPDMLWCMSPSQGLREGYFKIEGPIAVTAFGFQNPLLHIGADSIPRVRLNIISEASNVNSILLNGSNVSPYFKPFPANANWMYAHIPLDSLDTTTIYHLTAADKIIAYPYRYYTWGGWSFNISDMYEPIAYIYDTVYKCSGSLMELRTGDGSKGLWSNGDTGSIISIAGAGLYKVGEVYYQNCDAQYIEHQYYVIDTLSTHVQGPFVNDILFRCGDQSVVLNARPSSSYLWSNEDTTQSTIVDSNGIYWVDESEEIQKCVFQVSHHQFDVRSFNIDALLHLPPDTSLCKGDTLVLHTGFAKTRWSTGAMGSDIVVKDTGLYTAAITDTCDNVHIVSIRVYENQCLERYCKIQFPDAFTPNGDGKNDVFRAIKRGVFNNYHLLVYDRWGRCVFETYDVNGGWDGTYHGEASPLDTYMYLCTVDCPAKGSIVFKGDVTLIR